MNVNVSGIVKVDSVNVSAQVGTKSVNTNATIQQHNTDVSASVEHKTTNVSATAQTKSTNVGADVNPHIIQQNDHSRLQNLDYGNAGHTGFQPTLTGDNAGTGISIETDPITGEVVISNTQTSAEWGNIEGDITDQTDLNFALTSLSDSIDYVQIDVNAIEELIPAQATVNNQLADKDFVNSSIATSTATFRETYNVVTDLHLSTSATHQQVATALGNTISVADNNDYCFVEIPTDDLTPTETLQVDRYKYNGSSWSFEYTLNNSGYTSAQWKAINSGITSGKVTQYDDYATSKQDILIAGTNITIGADGKTISSDIPQATSQVEGKVLLGAAGGAATYESVNNRQPICYPTIATNVGTTTMDLKSSVSDNGLKLTEVGFVYNTSGNPTVSDTKAICDLSVGRIEKSLSGLTQNTQYYIKSYGINQGGTSYGNELVKNTNSGILPARYQLVDYLGSDGDQFINICYFNGFNVYDDYILIETINENLTQTFIAVGGSLNKLILGQTSSYLRLQFGTSSYSYNDSKPIVSHNTQEISQTHYNINGNYIRDLSTFSITNEYLMKLFSSSCKISYFKFIYLRKNINVEMYSCYDTLNNNKPGMYDIVNNVFYTNDGTGEFIVGPDAPWSE